MTVALDAVFAALANSHRRAVLVSLALQPSSISGLASEVGLSLPAMHKHIRGLEDAGLVVRRKQGRVNFIALNRAPLAALQTWVQQFHPWWGTASETLDNYLEHLQQEQDDR